MARANCARTAFVLLSIAVVMTALAAFDAAADFAGGEDRRVHVGVGCTGADRAHDLIELPASIPWPVAVSTWAGVIVPVTVPPGVGQNGVTAATAAGAGVPAVWQSQTTMPPTVCRWPKWIWAWVTAPSLPPTPS